MAHRVLTEIAVSITDHTKNSMATVAASMGLGLVVLMDLVEDLELDRLSASRPADKQDPLRVSLTAL